MLTAAHHGSKFITLFISILNFLLAVWEPTFVRIIVVRCALDPSFAMELFSICLTILVHVSITQTAFESDILLTAEEKA